MPEIWWFRKKTLPLRYLLNNRIMKRLLSLSLCLAMAGNICANTDLCLLDQALE